MPGTPTAAAAARSMAQRPWRPTAPRIGGVGAARRSTPPSDGRRRRRAGEHRHAVERPAGRHDAAGADPAARRLEPDDAVARRRHPARAGRVGAEGEVDQPGGDGDRRAGARPAGDRGPASGRSGQMPYGERTPTRPVANWSRLVLPTTTAPASTRRWHDRARGPVGAYAYAGQPAVVGTPATSMLSLTASVAPASGSVSPAAERRVDGGRRGQRRAASTSVIQIAGPPVGGDALERGVDDVGDADRDWRAGGPPCAVSPRRATVAHGASRTRRRRPTPAARRRTPPAGAVRNASIVVGVLGQERRGGRRAERRRLDVEGQLARPLLGPQVEQLVGADRVEAELVERPQQPRLVEVRAARRRGSTPARCARRTGSRPGPPCRRCTGRRRRCRRRSPASTCGPGCTSW